MTIPEELVKQFRAVAGERLDRIESAWSAVMSTLDESAAELVHRELHTLKGESKMLGFSDVNLVCHKLEDLLEVARARGYSVDEDFDLIVNMAVRFMGMLVRKKVGAQLGGIDLPGFLRQIDSLLAEIRPAEPRARTTGSMTPIRAAPAAPRVSAALRARLVPAAVDAFIEYASAHQLRRDRLRTSWHALRELVGIHRAVIGAAQLQQHRSNAQTLARELGKSVDVVFDIDSVEATAEILSAIDASVLHLVRNALDHGLGTAAERTAAGKPASGSLRVRCGARDGWLSLVVEDDGRGVSLDAVRARARELGLVEPGVDITERWVDLVCHPGFTTRARASQTSGRGAGLDAVRHAVVDAGGTLSGETVAGRGTTWTVAIPLPKITLDVHALRAPGLPFTVVIDRAWQPVAAPEPASEGVRVFDLAYHLGIVDERSSNPPTYFAHDGKTIGLVLERDPVAATARRVVLQPPPAANEVVVLETSEALLVHPDRLR